MLCEDGIEIGAGSMVMTSTLRLALVKQSNCCAALVEYSNGDREWTKTLLRVATREETAAYLSSKATLSSSGTAILSESSRITD
jgi:hypothetical protein